MGVGKKSLFQLESRSFITPRLGERHVEKLLRGKAFEPRQRPFFNYTLMVVFYCSQRSFVGQFGQFESARVRHVFAEAQERVDGGATGLEFAVMFYVTFTFFLVLNGRRVAPPVDHVAFSVELHPRSVEAVRDLVTNYGADSAVVHVGRRLDIEQRRLENAGRKLDAILGEVVEGVDDGGVDVVPLLALSLVAQESRSCDLLVLR